MKAPKLTIELVPSTAWGENLRKILKKEHWDILRKASYKRARYRCECCGGKGSQHPVECHEIWQYDDELKIQKLLDLIALCPPCHQVKHFGFASLQGNELDVREHLQKVNGWSQSQTSKYVGNAFKIWEERSKFEWQLDISWLEAVFNQNG